MIINADPHNGKWAYWQDQLFEYRVQPGKPSLLLSLPGVVPDGDFEQAGSAFVRPAETSEVESHFDLETYGFINDEPYEVSYASRGVKPGVVLVKWPGQGGLTEEQVAERGLTAYDRLTFGGEKQLSELEKVVQVRDTRVRSAGSREDFPAFGDLDSAQHEEADPSPVVAGLTEHLGALAPEGWQGIAIVARALGGRLELTTVVTLADGQEYYWAAPPQVSQWFHRLRLVTYRPGEGAWFTADYRLVPGEAPSLEFDYQGEPDWMFGFDARSTAQAELAVLPRAFQATPDWLLRLALADFQDAAHQARVRTANAIEQGKAYQLAKQPELRMTRLFDTYTEGQPPVAYRARLSNTEKAAVLAYLESAPVVLASRGYAPDLLHPEQEEQVPMAYHTDGEWVWSAAQAYYLRAHDVAPPLDLLDHIRGSGYLPVRTLPRRVTQRATSLVMGMPETHPGASDDWERAVFAVKDMAIRFSVSRRYISLGDYADQAWCLIREDDERYSVFWWWAGEQRRELEARFDEAGQAATYLIGQLYLNYPNLQRADDEPLLPEESPIQAMGGDPGLENYDQIDAVIVPEGHLVERFGGPEGNTLFDLGTGFARSTLPPEFARAPYGRFRMVGDWKIIGARTRPSEAQPGGARVYLLPEPLSEYLARGLVVELPPGEVRQ
ncbi:hypothetical protein JOF53_005004 [Crossiella equi]|uniref:TNT domain-containing protein n=1 Tax=Crossiella equi TaxID=130796 RepID=A0ABS5AIR7_9PSEU|nr:TNT domain-containing protein [Crossiella equi]MBP2476132.1 hypothetical protein [Crossiella equi]